MRLEIPPLFRIKTILHAAQGAVIALCIILTIAVFTAAGRSDGRTAWYFVLCWLSIPALIYQTMVPAWSRARKFSNIYAFASIDVFMAFAWLTAWATVANYVLTGKGKGTVENASGCNNFLFGSATRCRVSEATIVFGVIVMLLWTATAMISLKSLIEFQRTGIIPHEVTGGTGAGPLGGAKSTGAAVGVGAAGSHPSRHNDEEAFDSNMNLRDNWEVDEYDHDEYHDRYGGRQGGQQHSYGRVGRDGHHHTDDDDLEHGDEYEHEGLTRPAAGAGPTPLSVMHDHDHDPDEYGPNSTNTDYARNPSSNSYAADSYARNPSSNSYAPDDHDLSSRVPVRPGGPLGGDTGYHGYGSPASFRS